MRTFDVGPEADQHFWQEFKVKGLIGGVLVRDTDSGRDYTVDFFTPYTLREMVHDELSRHEFAVVPSNSVVVEDITPEHLQRAVDLMDPRDLVPN